MTKNAKTVAKYILFGAGLIGTGVILFEAPVALIAVGAACYVANKEGTFDKVK